MAAPRWKGSDGEAAAALERRDLLRDHDLGFHVSHQGDCAVDIFIPTILPPSSISSLLPRQQVFIGPEKVRNAGLSHL